MPKRALRILLRRVGRFEKNGIGELQVGRKVTARGSTGSLKFGVVGTRGLDRRRLAVRDRPQLSDERQLILRLIDPAPKQSRC